jgi:hypothetical protein
MMQQLEIEYFFPLTEQILLDLDFSQCSPHQYYYRAQGIAGLHGPVATGMVYKIADDGTNTTWSTQLNGWDIGTKQEPSKLRKFLMKYLVGWKWVG